MSVTPLFDQLAFERRSVAQPIDRRSTPVLASMIAAPLESAALTDAERASVAATADTAVRLVRRRRAGEARITGRRALHAAF